MIVKNYQPNPLNTFELRQLSHCPPHFFAVDFDLSTNEKKLSDWIWENLTGRFFLGDVYRQRDPGDTERIRLDSSGNLSIGTVLQKRAAFEIHSEASYFAMLLPDLNKF